MPYNSKQAAVDALRPGAKVVGEAPYTVKVANPQAGGPGQPAQIDQVAGVTLSIEGPDGTPDTIVVKEVGNNDKAKGGVGYDVVQGPQKATTKTSTPASGLERLDENLNVIPPGSSTPTVYVRDPKAPPGTQPFKVDPNVKTDPSTWTPITDPNDKSDSPRVIGLWDPANNKVGASVSAQAGAKTSDPGKWTPIYRTPGDSSTGIVGQWDPVNSELHAVSSAPDGTQIVATPTAIYTLDKATGKVINTQEVAQGDVNKQAVSSNGKVYVFDPKTGELTLPANVKDAATVGNSTTLKDLVWYDDQGNEVGRQANTNYGKAPITPTPTSNTTSPYIQVPDPQNPSQLIWVENKGRVTASDALQQLAAHLTGQVIDKNISVDDAKTIIDAANQRMTADTAKANAETAQQQNVTTAAGDILSNTRGNAQSGAGLLQQRAASASGMLQNILGQATGAKNLMSAPAGLGEQLVGGIGGWTADMMGGQSTLDSAARMVQMADPKSSMADPSMQTAVGVLHQMLDQYQQVTGQPHPAVAATQAAQQSAQNGGLTAPVTTAPPAVAAQQQFGGLAQGGANIGGMNLYPTPGSPGMPISGLAQGGGQPAGMPLMPGFVAPGAPVKPPPVTVTVG